VILNARLCKALLDRITDRSHIIETGTESYRFRRTLEKRKSLFSTIAPTTRSTYHLQRKANIRDRINALCRAKGPAPENA